MKKNFYKKMIIATILLSASIFYGQVGIGTTAPRGGLDINKPTTNIYGLVLPTNASPSNMQNPQGGSVPAGTIMYDSTQDCIKLFKNSLNGGPAGWSDCLGQATPDPSIAANCNAVGNGFNGSYKNGTAIVAANTFKVTIENNSFSQISITMAASDLTLSGVSGITVQSVSPSSVTINSGASQVVTYTLSGTPTNCGTLTGSWQKLSLNCIKTVDVAPNATYNCANGSWSTAVSPEYRITGLINGQTYTGTYSVPYTGGECSIPSQTITSNGLTLTYAGGSLSTTGTLNYVLSGTYTGANNGAVSFTTATGCIIYLGPCESCKELLNIFPGTADGLQYVNLNKSGTPDVTRVYCDMTTNGGGWSLIGVNGTSFSSAQTQKNIITGPSDNGYLPRATVIKIATLGTQVQLRSGASSTSFANKITSQPGGAAILALRDTSTAAGGLGTWHRAGGANDFIGNTAIPPVGTWQWVVSCAVSPNGWPVMYQSCGNNSNVHWFMDTLNSNRMFQPGDPWASTWVR